VGGNLVEGRGVSLTRLRSKVDTLVRSTNDLSTTTPELVSRLITPRDQAHKSTLSSPYPAVAAPPTRRRLSTLYQSTTPYHSQGLLFGLVSKLAEAMRKALTRSPSRTERRRPPDQPSPGPDSVVEHGKWPALLGRMWKSCRHFRFNLMFEDRVLETDFCTHVHAGTRGRTRLALIILLLHKVILAAAIHSSSESGFVLNLLLRFVTLSTAVCGMLVATFLVRFDIIRSRWAVNAFLGLLVALRCTGLAVDLRSDFGTVNRMLNVGDTVFLANWVGSYPLGRFNDLAILSTFLVLFLIGVRAMTSGLLPVLFASGLYTLLAGYLTEREARWQFLLEREVLGEMADLKEEEAHIHQLLRCCMPATVLKVLTNDSIADVTRVSTRFYSEVIVFVTDVVGFTEWSSSVAPEMVVEMLHKLVSTIDELVDLHGAEKIKTVGDGYMSVIGLEGLGEKELEKVKDLALSLQHMSMTFSAPDKTPMHMRIGIGIGQAIACIIGRRKWLWDLWGEAVVCAESMEQMGKADAIHISRGVFEKLHHYPFAQELQYVSREEFLTNRKARDIETLTSRKVQDSVALKNLSSGKATAEHESYFIFGC